MQIPNNIHARHWMTQKPLSASKGRWEVSKTGKQRPDKAQKLNAVVEISAKKSELSDDFEIAFNNAIYVEPS